MVAVLSSVPPIRQPPINIEIEQALLGAIFRDNRAYDRVSEFLDAEHFANALHGRIYAAIGKLIEAGQLANPVTLKNLFENDATLAESGGVRYLVKLAESAITIINAEQYGRLIHELHLRRQLIAVGQEIVDAAHRQDDEHRPAQQLAYAQDLFRRLGQQVQPSFGITIAAALASIEPAPRPWLIDGWIPRRQVTLLSGDGGVGKSLLALQLQVAVSSGTRWLGLPALPCRSFGLYAEDDSEELHRRLVPICEAAEVSIADLDRLAWRSAVDDPAELIEVDAAGDVIPTPYFLRIQQLIQAFQPKLVVLDASTNLFGGDEVRRRHVNGFITLLRSLAIKIDGAVVLLAHPSVAGISSGSGMSGSTHWNNAVRSRLYLTKRSDEDADPDERILTKMKANYSGAGDVLRLRYVDGAFIGLDDPSRIDRAALAAKADRVFMELLGATYDAKSWVSASLTANNYAPSVFAKHPDRDGVNKLAFQAALHRLLKMGRIAAEQYGRPSDLRSRLVPR